jgi:hypothetical protein
MGDYGGSDRDSWFPAFAGRTPAKILLLRENVAEHLRIFA